MTEPGAVPFNARVDIPVNHPCVPGHFPGQAILPGVLLLERVMSLAQTSLEIGRASCRERVLVAV